MVVPDIEVRLLQFPEDAGIGGDDSGLMAVAPGEVLRGDDGDAIRTGLQQYELGVIIGEETAVDISGYL